MLKQYLQKITIFLLLTIAQEKSLYSAIYIFVPDPKLSNAVLSSFSEGIKQSLNASDEYEIFPLESNFCKKISLKKKIELASTLAKNVIYKKYRSTLSKRKSKKIDIKDKKALIKNAPVSIIGYGIGAEIAILASQLLDPTLSFLDIYCLKESIRIENKDKTFVQEKNDIEKHIKSLKLVDNTRDMITNLFTLYYPETSSLYFLTSPYVIKNYYFLYADKKSLTKVINNKPLSIDQKDEKEVINFEQLMKEADKEPLMKHGRNIKIIDLYGQKKRSSRRLSDGIVKAFEKAKRLSLSGESPKKLLEKKLKQETYSLKNIGMFIPYLHFLIIKKIKTTSPSSTFLLFIPNWEDLVKSEVFCEK